MVQIRLQILDQHGQVTIGIIISIIYDFFGQNLLYSVLEKWNGYIPIIWELTDFLGVFLELMVTRRKTISQNRDGIMLII